MVESLFRLSPLSRQQDEADRIINEYAQRVIDVKRRQIGETLTAASQSGSCVLAGFRNRRNCLVDGRSSKPWSELTA